MEREIDLERIERAWQRVTGRTETDAPETLIRNTCRLRDAYGQMTERCGNPSIRRCLYRLRASADRQLLTLQREAFLLSGDSFPVRREREPLPEGFLERLRLCWQWEEETSKSFLTPEMTDRQKRIREKLREESECRQRLLERILAQTLG